MTAIRIVPDRPAYERLVSVVSAFCTACAHHRATRGVPCLAHTLPRQRLERAHIVGLVR